MRIFANEKLIFRPRFFKPDEGQEVALHVQYYPNGRLALEAICIDDGVETEPWGVLTKNLPDQPCGTNEVYVPDYEEHEDTWAFLVQYGIIQARRVGFARSGFVTIERYALTEKAQQEIIRALAAEKRKLQ